MSTPPSSPPGPSGAASDGASGSPSGGASGAPAAPPRRRLRDVLAGRSRDDVELGAGIWRRAHDRFRRAVDRYHQVLEGVPRGDDDAVARLEAVGVRLAVCLDDVRARCVTAQLTWPSTTLQIPGAGSEEHRAISSAATLAAQASEGAAMTRVAAPDDAAVRAQRARSAERSADLVERALRS